MLNDDQPGVLLCSVHTQTQWEEHPLSGTYLVAAVEGERRGKEWGSVCTSYYHMVRSASNNSSNTSFTKASPWAHLLQVGVEARFYVCLQEWSEYLGKSQLINLKYQTLSYDGKMPRTEPGI